jgi:hypothetical protein
MLSQQVVHVVPDNLGKQLSVLAAVDELDGEVSWRTASNDNVK